MVIITNIKPNEDKQLSNQQMLPNLTDTYLFLLTCSLIQLSYPYLGTPATSPKQPIAIHPTKGRDKISLREESP